MGVLLTASYNSINGLAWTVSIHDGELFDSNIPIEISPESVVLEQKGTSKKRLQRVVPGGAKMTFLVENQSHVDFITNLAQSGENSYQMKVVQGSNIKFIGHILPDLIKIEDRPFPYFASIQATDGLANLKDKNYYSAENKAYFDQVSDGVFRAEAGSDYVRTNVNTQGFWADVFDTEITDRGDRYNPPTSAYVGAVVANFHAKMEVEARPTSDNEKITLSIWLNGLTIARQTIRFEAKNVYQVKKFEIVVKDLETVETDIVNATVWHDNSFTKITIKKGASFYNEVKDIRIGFKNIYGSVIDHIGNALSQTNLKELYGTNPFFSAIMDWEINPPKDALTELGIPYNAFVTNFSHDPVKVVSVYDALKIIATRLNGRFRYADGQYRFEQFDAFKNPTVNIRRWDSDFIEQAVESESVNQNTGSCLAGNWFQYLPALGQVELILKRLLSPDFLTGTANLEKDTDKVSAYTGSSHELKFRVKIKILLTKSDDRREVFRIKIKIGDKYAYTNNLNTKSVEDPLIYSDVEWKDSPEWIHVWSDHLDPPLSGLHDPPIIIDQEFILPPCEADGDLTYQYGYDFTLEKDGFLGGSDDVVDDEPFWELVEDELFHVDGSNAVKDQTVRYLAINSENTKKHSEQIYVSDNIIFDEDPARLAILEAGEWEDFTWWVRHYQLDIGAVTDEVKSDQMLASSIMAGQVRPIMFYIGTRITSSYDRVLLIDGRRCLFNKGSYNTKTDEITGEWIEVLDGNIQPVHYLETTENEEGDRAGTLPSSSGTSTTGNTNNTPTEVEIFETFGRLTATDVIVTKATLPDPSVVGSIEINRLMNLRREGVGMEHPEDYAIDFASNKIIPTIPLDEERLNLRIKIK